MMNTPTQIRMTYICNQEWESMSPTANGRFCEVCNHEVVDFTEKSIEELKLIKAGKNENLCGRFKVLPDPNIIAPVTTPKSIRFLALFSSMFLSVSIKTLGAQTVNKDQTEQTDKKGIDRIQSDTIYIDCVSTGQLLTDSSVVKPKPFLTTRRKEYYWTKKFPFVTKTYKPIKAPIMMGRYL